MYYDALSTKLSREKNSAAVRFKVSGSEKMGRIYLIQYRIQRKAGQRGTQKLNTQFHKRQEIS
jgi:hypothetical protein